MPNLPQGARSGTGHVWPASLLIAGAVALACIFLDTTQVLAEDSSADVMTTSALNAAFDADLAWTIRNAKVIRLWATTSELGCKSAEFLNPVFVDAKASFEEKLAAIPEAAAKANKEIVGTIFCEEDALGREDLWEALALAAANESNAYDGALILGSGALGTRDYAAARQYLQKYLTYQSKILDRDKERGKAEEVAKTEARIDAAREKIAAIDAMQGSAISPVDLYGKTDGARDIRQSFMNVLEAYAARSRKDKVPDREQLKADCLKIEKEGVFANSHVDAAIKLSAIEGAAKKVREQASKQGDAKAARESVKRCRNLGILDPGWAGAVYATAYYEMTGRRDGDLVAAYYGSGILPKTDYFRAQKYLSLSDTLIDQNEHELKERLNRYTNGVLEDAGFFDDEDPSTMTPEP